MKSLKYFEAWGLRYADTPKPKCTHPDDVVVEIKATGICGTDVGIVTGDYPVAVSGVTIGHETSGVISEVGSGVQFLKVGDRVTIDPTYACGQCRRCNTGRPNHCCEKNGCEAGVSSDGAFSQYFLTTEPFLLPLQDHVSFESASLTEPLSCALTGVDALGSNHIASRCVVIGAGPMGLLYAYVLSLKGYTVTIIESNQFRLEFAKNCLRDSKILVFSDLASAAHALYGSAEAELDICVDTSGKMLPQLTQKIAPGGKILLVALKTEIASLDLLKIADKSISVLGSIDSLNNSFYSSHHLIETGKIPVERLISHRFPLDDYKAAFDMLGCELQSKRVKPIIEPCCKIILNP